MNRIAILVTLILAHITAFGQISFTGNQHSVYTITPNATTGLNNIYVLHDTQGVSITYTANSNGNNVKWYSFSSQGGAYSEPITAGVSYAGNTSTLSPIIPNSGYIIEDGDKRTYFWVIDYADYPLYIENITPDTDFQECGITKLKVSASGKTIPYYTLLGESRTLSREIKITYNTLEWDGESQSFIEVPTTVTEESVNSSYLLPAPLCNTTFNITGDIFQESWGESTTIDSDTYLTNSVSVVATATQIDKDGNPTTELGGSAPVEINFTSYNSDAVMHNEWQISTTPNFSEITSRYYETEKTQTFNQAGTFYARYIGSNSDGTCSSESETFTISISESFLKVSNAFSPTSSPGVNDIWKPSYQSIVSYNCWVFNRWGVELFHSSNPETGWDGTFNGKPVKSGAYFYVIEAKGADGIEYKLKGDVNIINSKAIL